MKFYKKWAKREVSFSQRMIATLGAGLIFALTIPYLLAKVIPLLDPAFHLPSITFGMISLIIGGILIIAGFSFGIWSIVDQLILAGGTPLPVMATQKLLVMGAFKYCRNPMAFGTIVAYTGISIFVGSLASLIAVAVFALLLMLYIKLIEERELEERFGQEYLTYKEYTSFIIPWVGRCQRKRSRPGK
ncbi:MAG: methyltransferase [Anaerolineaceae bacterium]